MAAAAVPEEFSGFPADIRDIVKGLIDDDRYAKDFFEMLNPPGEDTVQYVDTAAEYFRNPQRYDKPKGLIIIPTTIPLHDDVEHRDSGTHSVAIVAFAGDRYWYDPNGGYGKKEVQQYKLDGNNFPRSADFRDYVEKQYGIKLIMANGKGVQQVRSSPEESYFINQGGYCMIYNYLFMRAILGVMAANAGQQKGERKTQLKRAYKELTIPSFKLNDQAVFPKNEQVSQVPPTPGSLEAVTDQLMQAFAARLRHAGGGKRVNVPKTYLPKTLTRRDRAKQRKALRKSRKDYRRGKYYQRPRVRSFRSKESKWVVRAKKEFGVDAIVPSKALARVYRLTRGDFSKSKTNSQKGGKTHRVSKRQQRKNNSTRRRRRKLCASLGKYGIITINPTSPPTLAYELKELTKGDHGLHIHVKGSQGYGKECQKAGPHYNPKHKVHGGPKSHSRHLGDLGNVRVNSNGIAKGVKTIKGVKDLKELRGRSVIVHADRDDLGRGHGDEKKESEMTGNAGARLACGILKWVS